MGEMREIRMMDEEENDGGKKRSVSSLNADDCVILMEYSKVK